MSDGAHVTVEALDEIGSALTQFAADTSLATTDAARAAERALHDIKDELKARELFLLGATRRLAECEMSDRESCAFEAGVVKTADERVEAAKEAQVTAMAAVAGFAGPRKRFEVSVSNGSRGGIRHLAILRADIEQYARGGFGPSGAVGGIGGGAAAGGSAPGGGSAGGTGPSVPAGFPEGFALMPLSMIDGAESDPGDWKSDVNPADLRWGLNAVDEVVMPAMAGGKGPDYFRDRDTAKGVYGSRSLSDTYSGFFGTSEAIKLQPAAGGRYTIENGRHRVWLAREMGFDAIPVRLR
ncbi:MAG: hypothetical protein AAGC46_10225 [Solirubrobacteraceae bacterium]|nr:hypothetical protein [Patulibacter sp.]